MWQRWPLYGYALANNVIHSWTTSSAIPWPSRPTFTRLSKEGDPKLALIKSSLQLFGQSRPRHDTKFANFFVQLDQDLSSNLAVCWNLGADTGCTRNNNCLHSNKPCNKFVLLLQKTLKDKIMWHPNIEFGTDVTSFCGTALKRVNPALPSVRFEWLSFQYLTRNVCACGGYWDIGWIYLLIF